MLKLPVKTLRDFSGEDTFRGELSALPTIGFPSVPFSFETLKPGGNHTSHHFAITVAAAGAIESLFDFIINAESGGLKVKILVMKNEHESIFGIGHWALLSLFLLRCWVL